MRSSAMSWTSSRDEEELTRDAELMRLRGYKGGKAVGMAVVDSFVLLLFVAIGGDGDGGDACGGAIRSIGSSSDDVGEDDKEGGGDGQLYGCCGDKEVEEDDRRMRLFIVAECPPLVSNGLSSG